MQRVSLTYPVQHYSDALPACPFRAETRANSHKLTEIEEESLQKWILSMDSRGAAPRPSTVREMADLLLAARGSTPPPLVGKDWVTKFVKRHPILSSRFSKGYNYARAKCEDPKIIEEWFSLVQKTIISIRYRSRRYL